MTELFRTEHGSHLYGLANENSDHDIFVVRANGPRKAEHTIRGVYDIVEVGMTTFLRRCMEGSHQSCEALFSNRKHYSEEGLKYKPMFESIQVTGKDVFAKYERTIRKFAFGDFKRRRHGARLWLNLRDMREYGRFDPTLSADEKDFVNSIAELYEGNDMLERLGMGREGTL